MKKLKITNLLKIQKNHLKKDLLLKKKGNKENKATGTL